MFKYSFKALIAGTAFIIVLTFTTDITTAVVSDSIDQPILLKAEKPISHFYFTPSGCIENFYFFSEATQGTMCKKMVVSDSIMTFLNFGVGTSNIVLEYEDGTEQGFKPSYNDTLEYYTLQSLNRDEYFTYDQYVGHHWGKAAMCLVIVMIVMDALDFLLFRKDKRLLKLNLAASSVISVGVVLLPYYLLLKIIL